MRQVVTSRYKIDPSEGWIPAPLPPTDNRPWRLVAVVELRRSPEPCRGCGRGLDGPAYIEMLAIWQDES